MTLDHAKPGETYIIQKVGGDKVDCRHLYALGFTDGSTVYCILTAPAGDPIAFLVRGAVIALRKSQLKAMIADKKRVDGHE